MNENMTKASKRMSWFVLSSLFIDLIAMIFGILAGIEFGKTVADSQVPKYAMLGATIIITIVLAISTLVAFFAMRNGEVKSAILALGKHTKIQLLAPLTCLVLGIIGLVQPLGNGAPEQFDHGLMTALIVAYVIVLFVSGFNSRGLAAFRKDKESYGYIAVTSFIIVVALIAYCVIALLAMVKVPATTDSHLVGYLETFAVLFTIGDGLAFASLGIIALIVKKYAPTTTMADADASTLTDINAGIQNLNSMMSSKDGGKDANPGAAKVDPVEEIRRYKKLLDDGIITKEEFEKKKKELLG